MSIYQKIANIQKIVANVKKDADNPFFKSKYATYEGVMETLRPHLEKEGLLVIHGFGEPKFEGQIAVTTRIIELSAADSEVVTTLHIPTLKDDPQAAGSAVTYAKRYMVLAMFGLGTEDDDGNSASKPTISSPKPAAAPKQDYDAAEAALCRIHQNPDGSAVKMTHYEKDGREWWSHKTANGGWCTGTATKYNREA